ncbi:putative Zinc finger, MIZ-type, Zinc finger, RING/FYVE/PHD-type [Helianthus annuus]|uniref:E3 SUMO protein ligase n=1 Tax=Helianthus annuus TaxID=4232 RepID=A0A251TD56_HELAN|nr:putative E3 SUMO protein ligase [Helianthus annuus]KAJ0518640.1 putative Zinc finger, MIZ-type, Zinc finger, RING/FYVE/PHD-type [Helianthus annuus]KAJ0686682.1 putative Zinc finger, MIZ-type, Zinc finger, RING/FYVE/PHD-type [Helianthus annuus]KAJ0690489.1 putative Zinc finger, MIZ-type, Zinc finger, RING/FYVE/PHD-type [Helianthus annuus]KAJ0872056.1 putative Zinc finger, MIZ-type, Zinc finger, RING/FYVE/PHD-type [Helianthus annuus]
MMVYKRKTELQKPSLMMLMLPLKAACQVGWFSDADKHGLLMIAKEVSYGFSSTDKMNIEPSNAHSCVSNIVSRFYPTMKVEHILTSFDVEVKIYCAIIEMSSRISLYCPISQQRIKTPVKGHLCKYPQCFDYNHFIELNSAIPTWKCPLCNNPVYNQDLRIDQDFLKILNEVAEDIHDVVISEDDSWMVAETQSDTSSHATVTAPAVSLGQSQN